MSIPDAGGPRRGLGSDTPTFYLTAAGTPIYHAIREQTGIDPAVINARPHWSFLEAYMRLFGKTPEPADTVGKITARADGRHAARVKGRHAAPAQQQNHG